MSDFPTKELEEEEQELESGVPTSRRILLLLLKLSVAIGLLVLVFYTIDTEQLVAHLTSVSLLHLVLAFLVLNGTMLISAFRMRYYFMRSGFVFKASYSIAIYYVGALFNIILPGGISGDGYKAFLFKRQRNIPVLTSVRLMLSERANGLLFLLLFAVLFAYLGQMFAEQSWKLPVLVAAVVVIVPTYFLGVRLFLKEHPRTAIGASRFSFFSQLLIVLSATFIFMGMGIEDGLFDYIALFMVSSVLIILPITIGGAGVREATFGFGAPLVGLSAEQGVAAALAFFAIHVLTSLLGILFLGRLEGLSKGHTDEH